MLKFFFLSFMIAAMIDMILLRSWTKSKAEGVASLFMSGYTIYISQMT